MNYEFNSIVNDMYSLDENYFIDKYKKVDFSKIISSNEENVLFFAHKKSLFEFFLKNGADINKLDNRGANCLFSISDIEVMKCALKNGADPNIQSQRGVIPLLAVHDINLVKLLHAHGAKITDDILINKFYRVNTDVLNELIKITKLSIFKIKDELLYDIFKKTHSVDVLKVLKKNGFDITINDEYGENKLFTIINYSNSVKNIKALVKMGLSPFSKKKNGNSLLFDCYDERTFAYLIKCGLDINHQNNSNETFIYNNMNPKLVSYGFKNGLSPFPTVNSVYGRNAFSSNNDLKSSNVILKEMIKNKGFYLNYRDCGFPDVFGNVNKLRLISKNGVKIYFNNEICQSLINNYYGKINYNIVVELKKLGFILEGENFSVLNIVGSKEEFHKIVKKFKLSVDDKFWFRGVKQMDSEFLKDLLDDFLPLKEFNINILDKYGRSLLFFVRSVENAKVLLDNGLDITLKDKEGQNCIEYLKINSEDYYKQNLLSFLEDYYKSITTKNELDAILTPIQSSKNKFF